MDIPILQKSGRRREYDSYSNELRSQVVRKWMFSNKTHRELDDEVLGLDKSISRGYQSMGILHFLGLKASFHGVFINHTESQAISLLKATKQNFNEIIKLLEYKENIISLQKIIHEEANEIAKSSESSSELRRQRIASKKNRPERLKVYTYTYLRNPDIIAEALYRASGFCESCKNQAPFIRASDGSKYLEVHHIKSLSDGGDDSLENVIALCPNCHRKMHYGR